MIKAIVYTSNTGTTKEYARLLGETITLPYYSMEEAAKKLEKQTKIIYLGWLMAGTIKGYKEAKKRYKIRAVCAVGMGRSGTQVMEVRKKADIKEEIPVFTLQGGFDINKLSGAYKFAMNAMIKVTGKALQKKEDKTKEEEEMLELILHGGNKVDIANLKGVFDWYQQTEAKE